MTMNKADIQTEEYKAVIDKILNEMPAYKPKVDYVGSVYAWAKDNNIADQVREDDIAASIRSKNIIAIQKVISEKDKNSVIEGIEQRVNFIDTDKRPRGFSPMSKILDTKGKFVEHTIRHERAHITGIPQSTEAEADVKAFEEMGHKVVAIEVQR
jgi:hypothetical protein